MDDAVGGEDVDGDDARVEVEGEAFEAELVAQTLWAVAEFFLLEEGGDGARSEDTTGRVEVTRDVVEEDVFDELLGGLVAMLGNSVKGFVCRGKDSEVGGGTIEQLDQVIVFRDQLGEFGRVFALGDEFVHGQVRLVMRVLVVRIFMVRGRFLMIGRSIVRWPAVMRRSAVRGSVFHMLRTCLLFEEVQGFLHILSLKDIGCLEVVTEALSERWPIAAEDVAQIR